LKKKELSYADAIHLTTAILSDSETLYSSDPDFEDIDEIKLRYCELLWNLDVLEGFFN